MAPSIMSLARVCWPTCVSTYVGIYYGRLSQMCRRSAHISLSAGGNHLLSPTQRLQLVHILRSRKTGKIQRCRAKRQAASNPSTTATLQSLAKLMWSRPHRNQIYQSPAEGSWLWVYKQLACRCAVASSGLVAEHVTYLRCLLVFPLMCRWCIDCGQRTSIPSHVLSTVQGEDMLRTQDHWSWWHDMQPVWPAYEDYIQCRSFAQEVCGTKMQAVSQTPQQLRRMMGVTTRHAHCASISCVGGFWQVSDRLKGHCGQ